MRQWALAVVVGMGCTLAGCGSGSGSGESGNETATPRAAASRETAIPASGNASAAQVAAEARGKLKCPAKAALPARAAGEPVDDVVGVRPGMTYDEARHVVLCTHELLVTADARRNFPIQTHGQNLRQGFVATFARERVQRTSQQILNDLQDAAMARGSNRAVRDVNPGEAKWYVATMGLPGEERVISAAREEWFEPERAPTAASIEQALASKYGPPTHREHHAAAQPRHLIWAYDLRQRPITEASPLHQRCQANADPDVGNSFSPDCGVVVAATIQPRRENPELAAFLQVAVMDQAGGYQAIADTEQALQDQESRRRNDEVERAGKNARAPTL